MLDACKYPPLEVSVPPPLPVAGMVRGMEVEAAADVLPRLFNLCREAQALAARAAFGLPATPDWQEALRREILRAHVAKLAIQWPALLEVAPLPLPRDWQSNTDRLRVTLFGGAREMPRTPDGFERFLLTGEGVAPLLDALSRYFAPGAACREELPCVTPETVFLDTPQDNSLAARHAAHPVMQDIAARIGRGPLWAATALCIDLDGLLDGDLPEATLAPGRAVVPAARGVYGVNADVRDGRVAAFTRVTPTDHLLRRGGVMQQCLASLPAGAGDRLGHVLLAVLDPCVPVTLTQRRTPDA